jgi:peptidoglycan-N-acetylglucosamine deacetylase
VKGSGRTVQAMTSANHSQPVPPTRRRTPVLAATALVTILPTLLVVLVLQLGPATPPAGATSSDAALAEGAIAAQPLPLGVAVRRLPNPGDTVGLTFDDGPDPRWTPAILDVLDAYGAKATFFMIGSHARRHPALVAEVVRRGHRVEGHTWSHRTIHRLGGARFAAEVDQANRYLEDLTASPVRCVRPPQGAVSRDALRLLHQRGLATVLWSHDTRDWRRPGVGAIERAALRNVTAGSILLLHDGGGNRSQTVAALPRILEGLAARGLRAVPAC